MKILSILLAILCPALSFAQCKDIYGAKCECPTEQDSLLIYNNAIVVVEFYDKNKSYILKSSTEFAGNQEKREVFDKLEDARRMYHVLRRSLKTMSDNPNYKDITYKNYYNSIDDNRFYQRELENQIVNSDAPFPIYDNRIAPILMNIYECNDTGSVYFGDLVQIPLYIPVVVKPYDLLTSTELALRNKILHIVAKDSVIAVKPVIRDMIKRDSTVQILSKTLEIIPKYEGTAIYCYNEYGSACIIGFIQNRVFVRIKPSQYKEYSVMKFAQNLLSDLPKLNQYLYQKFGSYIVQIL